MTTTQLLITLSVCGVAVILLTLVGALYVHSRLRRREYELACMYAWHTTALHHYLQPKVPLPEAGGWALSPDLLSFLVRHIEAERPRHAVELGSGLSTVVLGRAMKNVGGCLTSIEADTEYLARTRVLLDAEGLDNVTLIHAPITPRDGFRWYDHDAMKELAPIDLLLVDGPPTLTCPLARYPALPFFWSLLREGAAIVMDDADRRSEQQTVARWRKDHPKLSLTHLPLYRSPALLRKPG